MKKDISRQAAEENLILAKQCAALFDVKTIASASLASLAQLYTLAEEPELVAAAVDRGLAATTLPPIDRATLLLRAVEAGLKQPNTPQRNAQVETLVEQCLSQCV